MTRWTLAGFMALAGLGAAAAFDVGSKAAEAATTVNQFAGTWSGTWSVPERGLGGTFDWTISDSGRISGTVHDTTRGGGGTVVGHVGVDGRLTVTCYAPNDVPATGSNGFAFQGTASIDDGDKLIASVTGLGESQSGRPALVALLERR